MSNYHFSYLNCVILTLEGVALKMISLPTQLNCDLNVTDVTSGPLLFMNSLMSNAGTIGDENIKADYNTQCKCCTDLVDRLAVIHTHNLMHAIGCNDSGISQSFPLLWKCD